MAQSEQTYTVAGTSVMEGGIKTFRFSNSEPKQREYTLAANGHTEINLVKLPRPMDQVHAIAWLMENMRGCKDAVLSTRAADKEAPTEKLIAAQELYKRRMKSKTATPKKRVGRSSREEAAAA